MRCICRQAGAAPALVQALLLRYSTRPPLPARASLWVPPEALTGGAVMRFVRTAAGECVQCMFRLAAG